MASPEGFRDFRLSQPEQPTLEGFPRMRQIGGPDKKKFPPRLSVTPHNEDAVVDTKPGFIGPPSPQPHEIPNVTPSIKPSSPGTNPIH